MSKEKFKAFAIATISLLKKRALDAKKDADNPTDIFKEYAQGAVMGYYSIINLLKHQAFAFCIDQKELGLSDIEPDVHLLGLRENPDIEQEEDNWSIEAINEEKIKGYLSDTVVLLKEQAIEAKKEGFEDYIKGELESYCFVFALLKNQAKAFNINLEDIGLVGNEQDEICSESNKGQ